VTEAERGSEVDSLSAFEAPAKRPDEIARDHYLAGWYRDERQDLPAAA